MFVTHDIDEALRLASVIGVLDRGRLAQWGTPLEIIERPASPFVAEFVGGEASGLKLLGLHTVAERVRHGEAAERRPADERRLAARRARGDDRAAPDRLPVVDASGRTIGAITLGDLVR